MTAAARVMDSGPDQAAVIALACRKGISFQAALRQLAPRPLNAAGDTEGARAAPQHTKPTSVSGEKGISPRRVKPTPVPASTEAVGSLGMVGDSAPSIVPPPSPSPLPEAPAITPAQAVPEVAPPLTSPAVRFAGVEPRRAAALAAAEGVSLRRGAELAAQEAWLTANPVRREVDWGDLREDVETLQALGFVVARERRPVPDRGGQTIYLVNGNKILGTAALRKYAAKVREGRMTWQTGG